MKLQWDKPGERLYETGVSHGVLYPISNTGEYDTGVAWNGLTAVTQSPTGAEATAIYADNIKYLNLISAEDFSGTIEAYMSPVEFDECDGTKSPVPGVAVTQQNRRTFGFSWQTLIGNDIVGTDFGYKIHIAYGATAAPSEKSNATVNETPEAMGLSWSFSTTPVEVGGGLKPSAHLIIDSTLVAPADLKKLEDILYGTQASPPRLPLPAEVLALVAGTIVEITPTKPNQVGNVVKIPTTAGLVFKNRGVTIPAGDYTISRNTLVSVYPASGFVFPDDVDIDTDWLFTVTP